MAHLIWYGPYRVWAVFLASGLPRFLLPVFPIALAGAGAGWEVSQQQKWIIPNRIVACLLALIALSAAVGLALYSYRPICVVIGFEDKTRYLEQRAPDYQVVQAVNQLPVIRENPEKTLVFMRQLPKRSVYE